MAKYDEVNNMYCQSTRYSARKCGGASVSSIPVCYRRAHSSALLDCSADYDALGSESSATDRRRHGPPVLLAIIGSRRRFLRVDDSAVH